MLKRGPRSASRRNRLRMASVFLAFALLLVLFYIPGYWYVRGVTRQNALEYYRQRLLDGAKALDVTLSGLGNLQEMLNQNPLTRALGYPSSRTDMTAVDKVRDAVRIYLLPYAMAADAGLSRGEEILFTRRRVYHPREQLQAVHYFRSEGLTTAQWLSKLSGPVSVLPEEAFRTVDYGAYRGFTVAWRWSRANDMYLFATFPTDKVFSLIADEGVLAAGHAAIAWGGRVIASSGASPAGAYEDLSAKADSLELEFSLRIPDAYIEQDLRQLHRLALSFLGVLVLASAVWV
ncbi:MAG TPA: hypothetical protein VLA21_02165, partial [Candidatus Limnocylindria bacterium]|nr:hypothetical protein [Candidatus Limnocylindria bacterium]